MVVGKNDLKKPLKHMIHTYYQSMVITDNNNNPYNMDSSSNLSNTDDNNSMVDSKSSQ